MNRPGQPAPTRTTTTTAAAGVNAPGLDYHSSGVNYDVLDAFKRACQREAAETVAALAQHGLREAEATRGESAYLVETADGYLAHVEEGLGTKNLVADAMERLTLKSYYAAIGIDTVATIVNDLVTTGALPISVAMHAAVGDTRWFENTVRATELARGFGVGCSVSNAAWGGGETPALVGIVNPETVVLAGSAVGLVNPKSNRIAGDVRDGDAIVFLASSGVHTNGLTLCRALAGRLPEGYLTKIDDGRAYGEALLDPSLIYVPFVAACQRERLPLHYAVHVTGHGWRKLMRLTEPFVYRVEDVREPLPIFRVLARAGGVDVREMSATFNMGVGFAVYVTEADVPRCVQIAQGAGYDAWRAGTVLRQGERKAVEIPPLDLRFEGDTLQVR